jgi:hypothetical protein
VRRTARSAKDRERPAAAGEEPVPEGLPAPGSPDARLMPIRGPHGVTWIDGRPETPRRMAL